jgi:hypothetical protein
MGMVAHGEGLENIQHPTSNIEQPMKAARGFNPLDVGCWMLVVGCFILTDSRILFRH